MVEAGRTIKSMIEKASITMTRLSVEIWILRTMLLRAQKEVRNMLMETRGMGIFVERRGGGRERGRSTSRRERCWWTKRVVGRQTRGESQEEWGDGTCSAEANNLSRLKHLRANFA